MFINPIFDKSITGAPNAPLIEAGINTAISILDGLYRNPVTLNITFGWGTIGSTGDPIPPAPAGNVTAGANEPAIANYTYDQVYTALTNHANAAGDSFQKKAVGNLSATDPTPVVNGHAGNFALTRANAKALGLIVGEDQQPDGSVGFNSTLNWNFGVGAIGPGQVSLVGTAEHEITEEMGRISLLGHAELFLNTPVHPNSYMLMDLYRYKSVLGTTTPDFAPGAQGSAETAVFSIDKGTTQLASWNNDPSLGDLGDWAVPPAPADVFGNGTSGIAGKLTTTDVALMNALGWDLYGPASQDPFRYIGNGVTGYIKESQFVDSVTIGGGGFLEVANRGQANNTKFAGVGSMQVDAGAYAFFTSVTVNVETVLGFDYYATVDQARQVVGGQTFGTTVNYLGVQYVAGGNTDTTIVNSGGEQTVTDFGRANLTQVNSGGKQYLLSGTAFSSTISGTQYVLDGGLAIGTTVSSGGAQVVSSGGLANGTIVKSGGESDVYAAEVTRTNLSGLQHVFSGGLATSE